ncbi:helical hairpin domain-containing protein [Streptococcus gallolyticus]|uniref:helical hairpin domain-containing protein n=1 Tax=Streptococcus gallolyticus TaxID=315405 RepID=UPI00088DCA76|nr:relaxase/mobilization nuclease domain-containing protein [Streptococcus gallolyticus]SDJ59894.1 Relaxase/Mobilisation nuclease domain-containing protein [Streptococcus gallolyticus]SDL08391.1 Relaxase/Mobilisation nuclease domain-containing protein [Streptococcus gallolyticus]
MVVTKVIQIKSSRNLKRAINYITRDNATLKLDSERLEGDDNYSYEMVNGQVMKRLVSGHDVTDISDPQTIYDDFVLLKQSVDALYNNDELSDLKNDKRVLAHHIIQSFSPEDGLTPEEVNEIGRKTALELTGGDYQFVVATHMDKGHLHNHIIFNTTNEVTLKKFRWQKGTKKSLEHISDKYAELYGAKVLEPRLRNSHTDYSAWRRKNNFRFEIKERLNFLLKHSLDMTDFLQKAKTLNLQVDTSGKYIKYKLLDQPQERFVRDRTLSKKGKFSLEKIKEQIATNEVVYDLNVIKEKYDEEQESKQDDFEMQLTIEPWQIEQLTHQSIYVPITFGLDRKGTVSIPARMLDQNEDGTFTAYLKKNDFFYFLNTDHSEQNRFIKGVTLIKQLSAQNGEMILTKNKNITNLDRLVDEFNFLAANNVTNSKQFENLQQQFLEQLDETDKTLESLNHKMAYLNKLLGALSDYQNSIVPSEVTLELLEKSKIDKNTKLEELQKEIKELQIERDTLKKHRDKIVKDYDFAKEIKQTHEKRTGLPL